MGNGGGAGNGGSGDIRGYQKKNGVPEMARRVFCECVVVNRKRPSYISVQIRSPNSTKQIHMMPVISLNLPVNSLISTQEIIPNMMPLAME